MENEDMLKQLGDKFRTIRESKGISQSELANRIGKDQPSINRLEQGNINPSYIYMLEVCEGLEINLSDLLNTK